MTTTEWESCQRPDDMLNALRLLGYPSPLVRDLVDSVRTEGRPADFIRSQVGNPIPPPLAEEEWLGGAEWVSDVARRNRNGGFPSVQPLLPGFQNYLEGGIHPAASTTLLVRKFLHIRAQTPVRKLRMAYCHILRRNGLGGEYLSIAESFARGQSSLRRMVRDGRRAWLGALRRDAPQSVGANDARFGIYDTRNRILLSRRFVETHAVKPVNDFFSSLGQWHDRGLGFQNVLFSHTLPKLDECGVLNEMFSNPFRPINFDPTWRTSTVLAIARQMAASHDYSPMPILADALQDAGCEDGQILDHCRSDAHHLDECWVLDMILENQWEYDRVRWPSLTDGLTGAGTYHAFNRALRRRVQRAVDARSPVSILIINFDRFKQINDEYGHLAGNQVLVEVARRIQVFLRRRDFLARYQSDNFAVLLPNTDLAGALVIGERIRRATAGCRWEYESVSGSITVSIGAATLDHSEPDDTRLIRAAYEALRCAKCGGRNRVCS